MDGEIDIINGMTIMLLVHQNSNEERADQNFRMKGMLARILNKVEGSNVHQEIGMQMGQILSYLNPIPKAGLRNTTVYPKNES